MPGTPVARTAARVQFQAGLADLRRRIAELGELVVDQVRRATAAWEAGDAETAAAVIAGDEQVDDRSLALDQHLYTLRLLEAPVAADLRLLHIGLIAVTGLERVGDLAVAIATSTVALGARPPADQVGDLLHRMAARAVDSLAHAVQAVTTQDVDLAERIVAEARTTRRMLAEVVEASASEGRPDGGRFAASVLVARHLERIAENAGALAGRVRFLVTGEPFTRGPSRRTTPPGGPAPA